MGVRYVIQQRVNPQKLSLPLKYYLIEKSLGSLTPKDLVAKMVQNTSLTRQEANTAIEYLFETLPHLLKLGYTVQLGEMGYFYISIRSEGSDNPEEATVNKIKSKHLRFICGKKLRDEINRIEVEKFPV